MYNLIANFLHKKFHVDAHYFLKGGFWLFSTQTIVVISGIITTALFAHYLSENDYGIYRYLIGVAAILSAFSLTGLGESVLQTAAKKYYNFYQETLRINFYYSAGIIIAGLSGAVYYWINNNFILAIGCFLISLFQPIINSFQFIPVYLQGDNRYKESTINQLIKTVFVTTLSIATLFFTKNLLILFATYLISQSIANAVSFFIYKKSNHDATPVEIKNLYLSYAKHTSFRNGISLIAGRSDTIMIFSTLGAAPLAIYSIAIIAPEQLKGAVKNLMALLTPKYSRNPASFGYSYVKKRSIEVFLLLSLITATYIFLTPFLYNILFPKYSESILYSQIFALGLPSFIFYIPYSIIKVRLQEDILYRVTLMSAVTQISLLFIMTSLFGLLGAIISGVIYRYTLATIVYVLYFKSLSTK